jgi:enamine deaminase RidA (YjgF/YER057c/UK114 family)
MSGTPTERLKELGVKLPPPPKPAGTYSSVVVEGLQAFVAGQIVLQEGAVLHPGLVDRDVPPETAKGLAHQASLQALSALQASLGSLDRVRQIVRVAVYVASVPTFTRHHEVANGATEVLTQIFGDAGRPARVAVGVAALPLNAPVEVEMVVALSGA